MGVYAATTDVQDRLPGHETFDDVGGSPVSAAAVGRWIDEREAEVHGYLRRHGITVPVTASRGITLLRGKVADVVTGRVERAYVTGTDAQRDGADYLQDWRDFLASLADAEVALALVADTPTESPEIGIHSTWTDEGLSDDDMAPLCERGQDW